jgi:hypothetical protein
LQRPVPILLLACLLLPPAVPAEVYKWVDEEGRIHYGDARPRDGEAEVVPTPPPPPDEEVLRANRRLDAFQETERTGDKSRAQEAKEAARAEREERNREARCRAARQHLHVLGLERPLYHLDEQGNRAYLEDDQRAAEVAEVRKRVKEYCR